jgi:hypothetical protein
VKPLPNLIAFVGLAGCGKSTAATYLQTQYGYARYSFAQPLRDMLRCLGVSEHQTREGKNLPVPHLGNRTPRFLLQSLGTEWGRDQVSTNIWLNVATLRIEELKALGAERVVIDDCRFDNEAEWVRGNGGLVVRITRPGLSAMGHRSEGGVSHDLVNVTLSNDSTVPLFLSSLEYFLFE